MPDNQSNGALESFLTPFVPQNDLWEYAGTVSTEAKNRHSARFASTHMAKARLHTWLAWCEQPGRPYGMAIECRDLDPSLNPSGEQFVSWLEHLFS